MSYCEGSNKLSKLKKNKYALVSTITVSTDMIYKRYKPQLENLVLKYHRIDNGHPMLFVNTPIAMFANKYVKIGEDIWDVYKTEPFVLENCEFYNCYDDKYKIEMCKRLIKVVDSVKKRGYLGGKYKNNFIGLCIGVNPKFGAVNGYELISGKHRAAAGLAIGMKKMKCRIYKEVR